MYADHRTSRIGKASPWLLVVLPMTAACGGSDEVGGTDGGAVDVARATSPDAEPRDAVEAPVEGGPTPDGDAAAPEPPYHGFLQLRVDHDLGDADCLADDACRISSNEEEAIEPWLERIRGDSTLAVLHWNRAIPYTAFDDEPPEGTPRIPFYEQRLDAELVAWLDAFRAHFERLPHGFLQVSALDGPRLRPAKWHVREGTNRHLADQPCPPLTASSTFEVTGPRGTSHTIDFREAYTNFLVYLYEKLRPDDMGLVVEANLFEKHCPSRWDGFVELYHALYDAVRAEVGAEPRLFATLTYSDLLAYDLEACAGQLAWAESCDAIGDPAPYGSLDATDCYPLDASPLEALAAGGRMDVLGLSMYPDGLLMRVPDGPRTVEMHPPDTEGPADCEGRFVMPPVVDPWAQLDRLDWDRPIAITETSSRSCGVWSWFDNGGGDTGFFRIPNAPTTQRFWLDRALSAARERDMAFVVQSLYEDFPPIGREFLQAVDDPGGYNAINLWACSGFYTADGEPKSGVLERWSDALE